MPELFPAPSTEERLVALQRLARSLAFALAWSGDKKEGAYAKYNALGDYVRMSDAESLPTYFLKGKI